jgi:hypothetical protein
MELTFHGYHIPDGCYNKEQTLMDMCCNALCHKACRNKEHLCLFDDTKARHSFEQWMGAVFTNDCECITVCNGIYGFFDKNNIAIGVVEEQPKCQIIDEVDDAPFPPLKDSGERQEFSTGAVRDTATGKLRWGLVSPYFIREVCANKYTLPITKFQETHDVNMLSDAFYLLDGKMEDMIIHLEKGALKYSAFNWQKGMNISRCIDSLYRHLISFANGETDEDHKAAAKCNIMFIYHYMKAIERGVLPAELNDLPRYTKVNKQEEKT